MPLPRYQPGDHVKAPRNIDGTPVLAAAFVVTAEPNRPVLVEFLADGDRATAHPSQITPD